MIVKVLGTGLTLKRNQAYVMKYIMQNYKKVAFVLDLTRENRLAFEVLSWTLFIMLYFFFFAIKNVSNI